MGLDRMPQGHVRPHAILILPADPLPLNHARLLKVGDDPLNGPLRDPHLGGHRP